MIRYINILLVIFAISSPANAQQDSTSRRLENPTTTSPVDNDANRLIFQSLDDKKIVGVKIGYHKDSYHQYGNKLKHRVTAFSTTVSGPISKTQEPVVLANFDGLTNAASLSFNLSIQLGESNLLDSQAALDQIILEYKPGLEVEIAALQRELTLAKEGSTLQDKLKQKLATKQKTWTKIDGEEGSFGTGDLPDGYQKLFYSEVGYRQFHPGLNAKARKILGVEAKIGRQTHNFYDINNLGEELSAQRTPFKLTGYFGFMPAGVRNTYFGLNISYQESYKPQNSQTLCQDFPDAADTTRCFEARVGAPTKTEEGITQFEYRRQFNNWAMSPNFAYNEESNDWGVELPIFFSRKEKSPLDGGVAISYNSELREVALNFFAGRTFKLGK